MSAQNAAGTEGSLSTTAGDADNREPREGLPNGVTREERNVGVQGNDGSVALENPNAYDQNPVATRSSTSTSPGDGGVFLGAVEPPYDNLPQPSANVISQEPRTQPVQTPERRETRRTPTPTSSVRVQQFYSAESTEGGDGRDHGGVRWMARFTEFLRTSIAATATRGAHGIDRALDNLGLAPAQPEFSEGRVMRTRTSPVRFSPPEDFPQTTGPPAPTSWTGTEQPTPLFGPQQMAQLRQAQRDFPQLYGPAVSEGDSDRSSRLQAEVQRQLEEYTSRYQTQITSLVREVQMLRAERDEWQARSMSRGNQGELHNVPVDPTVPQGNPQHLPQREVAPLPLAPSEQRGELHNVPVDPTVPQGNPRHLPLSEPERVLQGDAPQFLQGEHSGMVQSDNSVSQRLVNEESRDDPRNVRVDPTVPRGNPQHLPLGQPFNGQARGQESGNIEGQARGQESGNIEGQARGQESTTHDVGAEPGHGRSHVPMNNVPTQPVSSSTAQQWLGPTTTSQDAMHLIAGGVAQLQAAMLKQMSTDKTGERTPETVKPGTTVLPSLPPVRSESASVDLLDWMELIEAPMCDLSDGSAAWWKQVRSKAAFAYDKWVVSGPMERLSITPEGTNDLEEGRWSRVNSRAASMVLTALDESIRSELVSRRMTGSVTAIVFRLLTLYQPGGEEEKYRTLQQLQSPPRETDPAKAVESLRAWNRWLRRCQELNIQAPDPSLQVRALNSVVKGVLEKNSEACFRTNLVRSNLKIDSNPTKESVEKLYKHLMGECESLATVTTSVATATTPSSTRPEPKLKPVKTETSVTTSTPQPPTPRSPSQNTSASGDDEKDKRGVTPCKFFGKTYKGCARLQKCPFLHTWEGLEREKPTRCLACGGKHMVKECPHKKPHGTSSNPAGASSTSTAASSTAKAPPTTPRNTASTSTTATAASKTVRIDDTPEVEHVPARGSGAATSDTLDLKEVLADVGKVLKAMSTTTLKKFTVEEATTEGQQRGLMETKDEIPHKVTKSAVMGQSENEESTGLLDSGASHPMRPAKLSEYQKGQPVKVTLAGEDVKLLMQNDHGTILVQEEQAVILPIVPLGAVIQELGYTLNWSPKVLRLTHPFKKSIKVKIRNHCPEVAACDALGLIRDLECAQVNALNERVASLKARLEVIKKEEKRDWLELLQEFAATGTKTLLLKAILTSPITKDLPAEVQTKLLQDFDRDGGESYLKALPLSRRKRRALVASRSWVVYLFSGVDRYKNDPFDAIPTAGKVVLEIDKDASKLWDLNRKDGVYQLLLWAACTGRIADIISSPPHSSWPTSQTPKYGPEAYAMRSSDEPYGIKDLAVFQRQRVDEETAHVAKQLVVWMLAQMCGKRNVGFLLETPATQQRLSERRDEGVSVWSTEMWKNFGSISGIKEFSFYKGAFGHRARCPTTIATTYPSVNQIDYNQGVPDDSVPATLLSDQELRRWPRNFKEFVAEAIKDYRTGSWKEEEEMIRAGVRVNKLTKEQREAWHRHLFNDHQPYRADCAVCINAQATGYQHRRRRHPSMYSMALDLAGPFKVKGRDMDHDDYKYIMVAAYRCPREYMSEKAAAELDKDFYVPDEASEHEDDDLLEVVGGGEEAGDVEGSGFSEDEKEEVPLGPETMDEAVEGLAQQEEWATIYVARPLRGRTNHYVVQAAKEILLQLRQSGLHVGGVHTDRAREFKAKAFKDWTVDSQLRHTKTAGADPAGNSSAELGIKWAKARVRTLLTASGAPQRNTACSLGPVG